jgi:hypothetical protein
MLQEKPEVSMSPAGTALRRKRRPSHVMIEEAFSAHTLLTASRQMSKASAGGSTETRTHYPQPVSLASSSPHGVQR